MQAFDLDGKPVRVGDLVRLSHSSGRAHSVRVLAINSAAITCTYPGDDKERIRYALDRDGHVKTFNGWRLFAIE